MKKHFYAAFTGWLQVALVSLNTYQIANAHLIGAVIVSFGISLVWTCNVRTALGSWPLRLAYCSGAAIGAGSGLIASQLIYV